MLLRNEGRRFGSRGIQEIKKDSKLQYGLQHSTLRGVEAAHVRQRAKGEGERTDGKGQGAKGKGQRGKGKGERRKGKGERGKGKGERRKGIGTTNGTLTQIEPGKIDESRGADLGAGISAPGRVNSRPTWLGSNPRRGRTRSGEAGRGAGICRQCCEIRENVDINGPSYRYDS